MPASRTLLDLFHEQVHRHGERPALRFHADGRWQVRTWRQWAEDSRATAQGLMDLGVLPGERVAILARTSREWAETDLGILLAGAATVPVHPQTLPDGLAHVLDDSGARVVFAEDPLQVGKLFAPACAGALRHVRHVACFHPHRDLERPDAQGRLAVQLADVVPADGRHLVLAHAEVLARGRRALERGDRELRTRAGLVRPDHTAAVLYAPRVVGLPRGILLGHGAFVAEVGAAVEQLELGPGDEQLLLLPLSHVFGKVLLAAALRAGCCTSFGRSPARALEDLAEVHPTFFGAVPGVFERLRAEVERALRRESPLRRRAAAWAIGVGQQVSRARIEGRRPDPWLSARHGLARAAVLEKVRRLLGRRLRFAVSGGAPLDRELAGWFHACDVLLLEAYGLTESTGASHLNRPYDFRFGTVGTPLPGVAARLGDGDEVLLRGPTLLQGHTGPAGGGDPYVDAEGWLHTGDLGTIDARGVLTITGRRKDLVVTAGGKNVAPRVLEEALARNPWIARAAVLGDRRPFLVALVVPRAGTVGAWAQAQGVEASWPRLCRHPEVQRQVGAAIDAVNQEVEAYRRIRRWTILDGGLERAPEAEPCWAWRHALEVLHANEVEALFRR